METENIMIEHINSIKTNIINDQVEKGHLLAERFFSICSKFRGFDTPDFDINENKTLLNDLLRI